MLRNIGYTSQFKRDLRVHYLESLSPEWIEVFYFLSTGVPLPAKYLDHELKGKLKGTRDCHIKNDLVLLYELVDDNILCLRLGTHSQLSIA